MNHKQIKLLVQGYLDGELDLASSLEIEEHLKSCQDCAREYKELLALRSTLHVSDLYEPASANLHRRAFRAALPRAEAVPKRRSIFQWGWVASTALLVVVLISVAGIWGGWFPANTDKNLIAEVQSAHVRSLMANHLTDVPSSDQHTVKPWFAGKLDFSPPVVDLATQGFPLTGGRLDYLQGHPVAALVYTHKPHLINLFIWPSTGNPTDTRQSDYNGYHMLHWEQAGMTFWAVSDMNLAELQTFVQLIQHANS